MPCPHDNLILLANGRLRGFSGWRTRRHVATCAVCAAEVNRLSTLAQELRTLAEALPSADLDERVLAVRPRNPVFGGSPARGMGIGVLLLLPFAIAALMMLVATLFIFRPDKNRFPLVSRLKITWKSPSENLQQEKQDFLQQVDLGCRNVNIRPVLNKERVVAIDLNHVIGKSDESDREDFQGCIDSILSVSKERNHGWSAQVQELPHRNFQPSLARYNMLAPSLFFSALFGLILGVSISLTILMLRAGGVLSVLWFAAAGMTLGFVLATIQSQPEKTFFHAEGQLILSQSTKFLWSREEVLEISRSEEIQRNLQDEKKFKIRFLRVENVMEKKTIRFSANGRYANYTAETVNLWMRRVQNHLLKDWKAQENPSRVEEMNPPVQIIEALAPANPISPDITGNVAVGLFLGLFLGGIYGYFYRGAPKLNVPHANHEERGFVTAPSGENSMRMPFSIVVGVFLGSSLALLVTLFQTPVYEARGKFFVKTQTSGSLLNVAELANTNTVYRRVQDDIGGEIPKMKVEPVEKTTILEFYGTSDNPDRVATGVNVLMKETMVAAKEKGIEASIVDPAICPSTPIGPNRPLNLALGAGIGGLFGLLLGFLRKK